ncbi:MAG: type II toxin-antitoxin system VapC family toxin [Methylovulum sp.]|uniref:PIN domain-containing protein n=1 Tax=Methylovulum sp. TaxID=1916980 RepID=UPI0026242092|nr:type II toxin-antitoxin system VapC family toxin [Methylovulum sp.]MDD2723767.1 type II toxin-antitoxin system VapC family toxin [Methylovulum sp.]
MIAIDTNVLLRFLFQPVDTQNPQWQVERAQTLINQAEKVFVSAIVVAEMEWVLESVFGCTRHEIHAVLHELASNAKFQFEDWAVLNCALLDYLEFGAVDLSDCLIARTAQKAGATTLFTFENEKKLGALPIATTLRKI